MNSIMNTYAYLPVNLTHGEGVKLYDDKNNEYIDFTSGIGVNSLGYNNTAWVKAVSNAASSLAHISNIFLNQTTLSLSSKLTELSEMSKCFLCNSGTEANEGAMKLARKYSFDKYGASRNKILSLKQSFHGRTMLSLTATGQDKFHKYFFPFPQGFDYVERDNLEDFIEKCSSDVCAVILEAVQGEGGVYPLSNNFVQTLVKICNEKDILVIFDEVQCGIGRTGKLFGFNHFDVKADIVTMAKGLGGGLPIGGFLCNEKLKDVFSPGDHGTTYGGNPVCCAGALEVLNEICNENTFNEINYKGELLKNLLLEANLEEIEEIRGKGLMLGIQTKSPASEIQKKALEKGLLVLTAGPNVVRLLPPLIINEDEIKTGAKILIESIIG